METIALFLYPFYMITKKDILLVVVSSTLTLFIQNYFFTNEEWVEDIVSSSCSVDADIVVGTETNRDGYLTGELDYVDVWCGYDGIPRF